LSNWQSHRDGGGTANRQYSGSRIQFEQVLLRVGLNSSAGSVIWPKERKVHDFLFQIVLLLISAIIGIVAQLLPRRGQKRAAWILAGLLVITSVLWAGYEIGVREAKPTSVADKPRATVASTDEPTVSLAPEPTRIPTDTPGATRTSSPPGVTPTLAATATHLPDAQPTSTTRPLFGEMIFCLDDELDGTARRCRSPQEMFTHPVTRINVSWTYQNVYRGMVFGRKWYLENQLIWQVKDDIWDEAWEINGTSEYTYLDVSDGQVFRGERVFRTGSYTVELYIGDELEQVGHFDIRK
jgi:hypothetical protein